MSSPAGGSRPRVRAHHRAVPSAVYARRRRVTAAVAIGAGLLLVVGVVQLIGHDDTDRSQIAADGALPEGGASAATPEGAVDGGTSTVPRTDTTGPAAPRALEIAAPRLTPDRKQGDEGASGETGLARVQTLGGTAMSPKSVVASSNGVVFAQNMMYRHSVSIFDADGALVRTIPDSVDLSQHGIEGHPGTTKGAPVEMAFSPDNATAWVSNYSMYGKGFGPEGKDTCSPGDGTDDSYLYRIDVATDEISKVIKVGAVPKYVAVTPDGTRVLVTNWCTWDLSVIDTSSASEIKRISLGGKYPRGIVVAPDSLTAYVALMGSDRIVAVDLATYTVTPFAAPGDGPRHVVISPDGATIYVTNNRTGNIAKIDRASGQITGKVATGSQPRSMTISRDGQAVYVVNYESATMTKVRTADMKVMQTVKTDNHPIGITYEPTKQRVWVACYGGTVLVFDDSRKLTD